MQDEKKYIPPYSNHNYTDDFDSGGITTLGDSIFVFDRPLYKKDDLFLEFVVLKGFDSEIGLYQRGDTEETKSKMFIEAEFSSLEDLNKYMLTLEETMVENGYIKLFEPSGFGGAAWY